MRVLLCRDFNSHILEVMSVSESFYDDELDGLCLRDSFGDLIIVKGISKAMCNTICTHLMKYGFYDLSIREYEYID